MSGFLNALDCYLDSPAFDLPQSQKEGQLFPLLRSLHEHHLQKNPEYASITQALFPGRMECANDLPFLPVSLFKSHRLQSVPDADVYKVLQSSGTTGQVPSQVTLDTRTAQYQTRALAAIMSEILGAERRPMLIVDSRSTLKNRKTFSARGAGILGMSVFGRKHCYCLDEEMELDRRGIGEFLGEFSGQPVFLFGFTFMVWRYLLQSDLEADFSQAMLVHSGGWKKLEEMAVDDQQFKQTLQYRFGIRPENVRNFYGMVEQVGSVFLEDEYGNLHCPKFSELIIRHPQTLRPCEQGEEGLVQVLSCLPWSYPGHSILTEDIGVWDAVDRGKWGGRGFRILGRVQQRELRGCSDTFEAAVT